MMLSQSNLKMTLGALVVGMLSSAVLYASDSESEGRLRRTHALVGSTPIPEEEQPSASCDGAASIASTQSLSSESGAGAEGALVGALPLRTSPPTSGVARRGRHRRTDSRNISPAEIEAAIRGAARQEKKASAPEPEKSKQPEE